MKEQRRRAAVGPLQIVDRQEKWVPRGDNVKYLRHLGEQVGLGRLRAQASTRRRRLHSVSATAYHLPQPRLPVCSTGPGRKPLGAPQQRLARHKSVEQVGTMLHQSCAHHRQRLPGTPYLLRR
jgi:hypothetical protein